MLERSTWSSVQLLKRSNVGAFQTLERSNIQQAHEHVDRWNGIPPPCVGVGGGASLTHNNF